MVWLVKIYSMQERKPKLKHCVYVSANSRDEAKNKVQSVFSTPTYGKYTASPAPGQKPTIMF